MSSRPYAEVIGDPIDHSLSPAIHGFWLDQLGIDADYRRHRVGRGELADYLDRRRQDPQWRGCNVTMPLKLDAAALADEASDRAIGTGAANLIVPREGKLLAGNTDVAGVAKLVERLKEHGAAMGLITLLGCGGAARAALMALRLLGISAVRIQSRDVGEAYKLAVQFRLEEEPLPFHTAIEGDGLINATPLGMVDAPPFDLDLRGLSVDGWVFDFVTAPLHTRLVERARARELKTVRGVDLLVEQAAESFALLFGAEPPRDKDAQLFAELDK